jgi:hypothetical protein
MTSASLPAMRHAMWFLMADLSKEARISPAVHFRKRGTAVPGRR